MEKKTAIVAVLAVALVAVVVAVLMTASEDGGPDMSYAEDVKVKIYGNANGDDIIDSKDIGVIEEIVRAGMPKSEWQKKYPFADADCDGEVTSADADIVTKYIGREKTRLYYQDFFGETAYVNYPLGDKVGVDMTYTAQFMGCVGAYDKIVAAPAEIGYSASTTYYPDMDRWGSVGSAYSLTIESLSASGIDVFVMWSNCLLYPDMWDDAKKSSLADRISFVRVDVTEENTDSGALMLGAMFNTEKTLSTSRAYADLIGEVRQSLAAVGEKKTVVLDYFYNGATQDTTYLTGGGTTNSFWTKKTLGFASGWDSRGNVVTSYEGIASAIASAPGSTFMCYVTTPMGMQDSEVGGWMKGQLSMLFDGLPPYENGQIWCFNEYAFAGLAAPFISYIIGAVLGYEGFDMDRGMDMLQAFFDGFAPVKLNAKTGFVFTPEDLFRSL